MGYKEVVNEAVESEATYKIITYPGAELPGPAATRLQAPGLCRTTAPISG